MPFAEYEGAFAIYMIFNAISRKELPRKPEKLSATAERLWKICQACWSFESEKRMTAAQAIASLDSMRRTSPQSAAEELYRSKRGLRAVFASVAKWVESLGG